VTTGRVCWRREASGGMQCAYSPWVTQPVCSSHVRVVENLRCGRTQAGEVWAANEAHAVHRNNDPGLVWHWGHWAAADSRWWLLRYFVAGWIPPRRRTDSLRWFIWGAKSRRLPRRMHAALFCRLLLASGVACRSGSFIIPLSPAERLQPHPRHRYPSRRHTLQLPYHHATSPLPPPSV
jgi:hypothetical protein